MRCFCYLLYATLITACLNFATAANIPPGTLLAEKQEIMRHIKNEPVSLDPIKGVGLPEAHVIHDLFEGLVNQDADGNIIPGVAERWHTADNQTYIFTLRKNARWSNGDPVVANDFVYSWRRLVDPKNVSPLSWYAQLAGLDNAKQIIAGQLPVEKLGVIAIDKRILKVHLNRPVPYFTRLLANFSMFPVHPATVERYGTDWIKVGNLVGNGAFRLQDRVVNERLVLVPNNYYWDHSHTVLTKVTFIPINQESYAAQRYQANDIDITESFPKHMYHKLMQDIPDQVYTPDQLGIYYYAFNTQRTPTDDARVRKALSYSINRKIIAEKMLGTGEKPAYNFTPDVTNGCQITKGFLQQHDQEELDEQAKALMYAAGYSASHPLKLSLLYNSSENNKKLAIAIASMWRKKLGVEVKLINQEWKTYIDSRNSSKFDVISSSWIGDYNEPSTFLSLLTSTHSGNIAKFKDAEYDHVLNDASMQTNSVALNDDYNKAEEIIAEQAPIAPIYQYTNGRLIKPWLKGYPITNPQDMSYSRTMYVLKH